MDVKVVDGDARFKFRANGVIIKDDKILTVSINKASYCCCPGGHVHLGEDSTEAVVREVKEETGFDVVDARLLCIVERFFSVRGIRYHELSFYHLIDVADFGERDKDFSLIEDDEGTLVDLDFRWVKIADLDAYDFKPEDLARKLKSGNFEFEHIISKD